MSKRSIEPVKRYLELDALRGIAAIMVVVFHYTLGRESYNSILKLGTTGVDLFFIISGFVIFMSLQHISGSREFIVNRVARLYPTYWAAVTFTFILKILFTLYFANGPEFIWLWYYGANLTMFQFYLGVGDLDSTYWTLLLEMLFYIFMLLLYKLRQIKHINIIGLALTIATVVAVHFFYYVPAVKAVIVYFPLLQFLPLFLMGINFYRIFTNDARSYKEYFVPAICLLCQIMLFKYVGRSRNYINQEEYAFMLMLYFMLFIVFVNNGLSFVVNKYTLFLGRISYAVYVVHQYVSLKVIFPIFLKKFGWNFWITSLCVALPVVLIVSAAITYWIEIPLRYRIKKVLSPVHTSKEENRPLC